MKNLNKYNKIDIKLKGTIDVSATSIDYMIYLNAEKYDEDGSVSKKDSLIIYQDRTSIEKDENIKFDNTDFNDIMNHEREISELARIMFEEDYRNDAKMHINGYIFYIKDAKFVNGIGVIEAYDIEKGEINIPIVSLWDKKDNSLYDILEDEGLIILNNMVYPDGDVCPMNSLPFYRLGLLVNEAVSQLEGIYREIKSYDEEDIFREQNIENAKKIIDSFSSTIEETVTESIQLVDQYTNIYVILGRESYWINLESLNNTVKPYVDLRDEFLKMK